MTNWNYYCYSIPLAPGFGAACSAAQLRPILEVIKRHPQLWQTLGL